MEQEQDELFSGTCVVCNTEITQEKQEANSGGGVYGVAQIIESNKFVYGISGMFELKIPDISFQEHDKICNACLNKNKDHISPAKTVKCSTCNELYQPINDNPDRDGNYCNCDVVERKDGVLEIVCGFGSGYDTHMYAINEPFLKKGQQVCDKCISRFEKEGKLKHLGSYLDDWKPDPELMRAFKEAYDKEQKGS